MIEEKYFSDMYVCYRQLRHRLLQHWSLKSLVTLRTGDVHHVSTNSAGAEKGAREVLVSVCGVETPRILRNVKVNYLSRRRQRQVFRLMTL